MDCVPVKLHGPVNWLKSEPSNLSSTSGAVHRGAFFAERASAYCRKIVFSGFGARKDPNSINRLDSAGVLRLRATSAVLCDESVRRSAQDDDFVEIFEGADKINESRESARESRCRRAYQTRLTFRRVLACRKTPLASYINSGKALSLRADDIGRKQLLAQSHPGRQLLVVSAWSEG
jgi:hypothetical protein